MVNQAIIQAKVNYGYSIAARILGETCQIFAPTDANNATTARAFVGSLPVRFDPNFQFSADKPALYGHPVWGAAFDRTDTLPGWIIVSPTSGTFFIAAQQPLLPTPAVRCNRTITLIRPSPIAGNYSGQAPGMNVIATGWPASILQGPKGEKQDIDAALPDSTRNPWLAVLMPPIPNTLVKMADLLIDDFGRRLTVSGAELTEFGWRLTADLTSE